MAYKVDSGKCVNCGACESDCPVGAISESGNAIDAKSCSSCGSCAASCPSEAISEE